MLSQTKDAVDRLTRAGFARSDFRVRTPRNSRGEYGMPEITMLRTLTGQDVVRLIETGFDVHGAACNCGCGRISLWPVWRPEGEAARVSIEQ